MVKYIWQKSGWPNFTWQSDRLLNLIGEARRYQGHLIGQGDFLGLESEADMFVEEAFTTSAIEGESLDRDSIRSSVAQRLGLPTAGLPDIRNRSDGLVEVLIDATRNNQDSLTKERLFGWHAALFPTGFSGTKRILVGAWRQSTTPMQVVSGPMGRERVHYEAPPSSQLDKEMEAFLHWFNHPPENLDGLIRAAIAHLWFVTLHPFEDGNGRLSRVITDKALSQDEKSPRRLYSLSSQIIRKRNEYYNILESTQKGSFDITEWLSWFLKIFMASIDSSRGLIDKAMFISRFYQCHMDKNLNPRQQKVIKKLLEYYPTGFEGGLTNRKYVKITKTSQETAKRDLKDLVDKGLILKNEGEGRSVSYRLNQDVNIEHSMIQKVLTNQERKK
jgi:Fic family protein